MTHDKTRRRTGLTANQVSSLLTVLALLFWAGVVVVVLVEDVLR